jgi:hypothetical protein
MLLRLGVAAMVGWLMLFRKRGRLWRSAAEATPAAPRLAGVTRGVHIGRG